MVYEGAPAVVDGGVVGGRCIRGGQMHMNPGWRVGEQLSVYGQQLEAQQLCHVCPFVPSD